MTTQFLSYTELAELTSTFPHVDVNHDVFYQKKNTPYDLDKWCVERFGPDALSDSRDTKYHLENNFIWFRSVHIRYVFRYAEDALMFRMINL